MDAPYGNERNEDRQTDRETDGQEVI